MRKQKLIAMLLSAAMLVSLVVVPVAAEETQGNWYDTAMKTWSDYGVIKGDANGNLNPEAEITRGELAVILDRLMDYQTKAENAFTDVKADQWYTEAVLAANAAGILKGDGDAKTVRPLDKITREEAAIMFARVLSLGGETGATAGYTDEAEISSWAMDAVKSMTAKGYLKGSDGAFRPKAPITRAEVMTILTNVFQGYYNEKGTYTENVKGSAVVVAPGVSLKNIKVEGDLILAEGVADGEVTLDGVTVTGKLIVRGGGENSIIIRGNSDIGSVVVSRQNGKVRVSVEGNADVEVIVIDDGCDDVKVEGTVGTLTVQGEGVAVEVTGTVKNLDVAQAAQGASLTVAKTAKVTNLTTAAQGASVAVAGTVNTMKVAQTATDTKVDVAKGAAVAKVETAGNGTAITGKGAVKNVTVTGGTGTSIATPGTKVENKGEGNVTVGDKEVKPGESAKAPGTVPGTVTGGGGDDTPRPVDPAITSGIIHDGVNGTLTSFAYNPSTKRWEGVGSDMIALVLPIGKTETGITTVESAKTTTFAAARTAPSGGSTVYSLSEVAADGISQNQWLKVGAAGGSNVPGNTATSDGQFFFYNTAGALDGNVAGVTPAACRDKLVTYVTAGNGEYVYNFTYADGTQHPLKVYIAVEANNLADLNTALGNASQVTLGADLAVADGETLTVPANKTLIVPAGKTLSTTGTGTIVNNGTIELGVGSGLTIYDTGDQHADAYVGANSLKVTEGKILATKNGAGGTVLTIPEGSVAEINGRCLSNDPDNSYRIAKNNELVVNGNLNVKYTTDVTGKLTVNGTVNVLAGQKLNVVTIKSGTSAGTVAVAATGKLDIASTATLTVQGKSKDDSKTGDVVSKITVVDGGTLNVAGELNVMTDGIITGTTQVAVGGKMCLSSDSVDRIGTIVGDQSLKVTQGTIRVTANNNSMVLTIPAGATASTEGGCWVASDKNNLEYRVASADKLVVEGTMTVNHDTKVTGMMEIKAGGTVVLGSGKTLTLTRTESAAPVVNTVAGTLDATAGILVVTGKAANVQLSIVDGGIVKGASLDDNGALVAGEISVSVAYNTGVPAGAMWIHGGGTLTLGSQNLFGADGVLNAAAGDANYFVLQTNRTGVEYTVVRLVGAGSVLSNLEMGQTIQTLGIRAGATLTVEAGATLTAGTDETAGAAKPDHVGVDGTLVVKGAIVAGAHDSFHAAAAGSGAKTIQLVDGAKVTSTRDPALFTGINATETVTVGTGAVLVAGEYKTNGCAAVDSHCDFAKAAE